MDNNFMKHTQHLLLIFLILTTLFGCNGIGDTDNPLFGKEYREVTELPEFKGYKELGGSVIEDSKDADGNYKLSFTHVYKKNRHVLIFEQISTPDKEGKVTYKILDTINVENVKASQFLTYGNCKQGEEYEQLVIAFGVITDDENDNDKVLKAWLADIKTGRINPLADTKGITCMSDEEDFEGCGEEEYEAIEVPVGSDTTFQLNKSDTVATQAIDSLASKE